MNVSESWLREWVNPKITTAELVEQLTMAGLEVDSIQPVAGEFSGVVVGEIMSIEQHPDADKLRVCQVAGGSDELTQVVCGAPNARVGIKIPFATVGAKLPGNFKIKKAKLRGVESFGMLCAQTELEAGDDDDGLWELHSDAPVGENLRHYLNLDDKVIEVDLTPNRSDCLSVKGLARETAVLNSMSASIPEIQSVPSSIDDQFPVKLLSTDACPKYVGRVIRNIDINAASPLWLQEKLRRSGVRSIDAVVDVTNFVLLELGQPMHAFDLDKLQGGIQVRMASADESLKLLDGNDVKLKEDTLVIADDSGALAIAGIMGGDSTAVSTATKNIFLESAFFHPIVIAGRARNYGLHTDSSHRFERGVDFNGAVDAMERATQLLLDIVGGEAGPITEVVAEDALPPVKTIFLSRERIVKSLSLTIDDQLVVDILTGLGLQLLETEADGWRFDVPSYRFDISIEADLLEELARIYGYNRLPTRTLTIPAQLPTESERHLDLNVIRHHLVARDYQEAITYSFIDPKLHAVFSENQKGVELLNPISADLSIMRTSLVAGLIQALKNNLSRQKTRIRLFESGLRFVPSGSDIAGLAQTQGIAGLIYGTQEADAWSSSKTWVDFYDIKGDVMSFLGLLDKNVEFKPEQSLSYMHPGQTASVFVDGERAGYLGALHPEVQRELGIAKPVFVFELDNDKIHEVTLPHFSPLSKFPEVSRDLAVVVDKSVTAQALLHSIRDVAGENLKDLKVFDVYSGEGIDPASKSLAFNLTFQNSSRTLNEEEITTPLGLVVQRLEEDFNAKLRQ